MMKAKTLRSRLRASGCRQGRLALVDRHRDDLPKVGRRLPAADVRDGQRRNKAPESQTLTERSAAPRTLAPTSTIGHPVADATAPLDRYEVLYDLITRHDLHTHYADRKSSMILVFVGLFLSLFTARIGPVALDVLAVARQSRNAAEVAGLLFAGAALLGFVASTAWTLLSVFWAINPRVKTRRERGHYYFGDIASYDLQAWGVYMLSVQPQELHRDMIEQVYATALIVGTKYRHIRRAIKGLFVMVPTAFALSISLFVLD